MWYLLAAGTLASCATLILSNNGSSAPLLASLIPQYITHLFKNCFNRKVTVKQFTSYTWRLNRSKTTNSFIKRENLSFNYYFAGTHLLIYVFDLSTKKSKNKNYGLADDVFSIIKLWPAHSIIEIIRAMQFFKIRMHK